MERRENARHPFPHFRWFSMDDLFLSAPLNGPFMSIHGHMERRSVGKTPGGHNDPYPFTVRRLKENPWTGVLIRVQMPSESKEALLGVRFFPLFSLSGGMKLHNQAGVHLRGHVFFPLSSSASSIKSPVGFPFFCGRLRFNKTLWPSFNPPSKDTHAQP